MAEYGGMDMHFNHFLIDGGKEALGDSISA